jgi:DDE superfamily endonuclease
VEARRHRLHRRVWGELVDDAKTCVVDAWDASCGYRTIHTIEQCVGVDGDVRRRRVCVARLRWRRQRERFLNFVEEKLATTLWPGTIVVLDNVRFHHMEPVRRIVEARGAKPVVIHPELNAAEELFSFLKSALRRQKQRTIAGLTTAIGTIQHCGPQPASCIYESCTASFGSIVMNWAVMEGCERGSQSAVSSVSSPAFRQKRRGFRAVNPSPCRRRQKEVPTSA